jgi:hypothetical protein
MHRPRIRQVLAIDGIAIFAKFAAAEVEERELILDAAGIRLVFPSTCPGQVVMAARDEWARLRVLQQLC